MKNYTLFETLLHFWCQKKGDGARAAPAAQQIESGMNVTTHQKKHGPSISANFSFTVKEEKIGLLQVHKSYHFLLLIDAFEDQAKPKKMKN